MRKNDVFPSRDREQRKIHRVHVVAKIEHSRKAGASELRLMPSAIGLLLIDQKLNATPNSPMSFETSIDQSEQRPSGLRSGDGPLPC